MDGRWRPRVAGEVQPRFMQYEYCICRQELTLMSAGQRRLNKPFVMHDIILSMFPVPFLQNYMYVKLLSISWSCVSSLHWFIQWTLKSLLGHRTLVSVPWSKAISWLLRIAGAQHLIEYHSTALRSVPVSNPIQLGCEFHSQEWWFWSIFNRSERWCEEKWETSC